MFGILQQAALVAGSLFSHGLSAQSFLEGRLPGKWVAQNELGIMTFSDGRKSASPTTVTLIFNADGHGSLQPGATSPPALFTYRLLSESLIEFRYSNLKPRRYSFYQVKNRLSFSPYPAAKTPQESIESFCALSFIKQ